MSKEKCSSNTPETCWYHGSLLRMEEAEKNNDLAGYKKAFLEHQEAKKDREKNSFLRRIIKRKNTKPTAIFDEIDNSTRPKLTTAKTYVEPDDDIYFDDDDFEGEDDFNKNKQAKEDKRQDRISRIQNENRIAYLTDTEAIPTPLEVFSLWVTLYEKQGNKIESGEGNYTSVGYEVPDNHPMFGGSVFGTDGNDLPPGEVSYKSRAWSKWLPTKNIDGNIPAGYGSNSMDITLFDTVDNPINLYPATEDSRAGWEYGHTTVHVIRKDDKSPYGYTALTNQTGRKTFSYKDVENYRKGKKVSDIIQDLTGTAGLPLDAKAQPNDKPTIIL
jgi:hypothetical protein